MKHLNVRMSEAMLTRLKDAAERDARSLNGEVLVLLLLALDMRETEGGTTWMVGR